MCVCVCACVLLCVSVCVCVCVCVCVSFKTLLILFHGQKWQIQMNNESLSSIQQVAAVHAAQLSELQHELERSKVRVKQSEGLVEEGRAQCQQQLDKQVSITRSQML